MIRPINFLNGPLKFCEEGAMGPFSKNLSLSNFCKIKNKYNIPLAVFEEQLQNLAFGEPQGGNIGGTVVITDVWCLNFCRNFQNK
jgi:hypothetical protein